MMKINTRRSTCAKSIAAAVALVLAGTSAFASQAGRDEIQAKLTSAFIPTITKPTTPQAAKQADFLVALSLAASTTNLTLADFAGSALEAANPGDAKSKYRTDKDKVAGQVIATILAAKNLTNDPAAVATVTAAVFNSNSASANAKSKLTATGQAAAIAGGLKAGTAAAGTNIGTAIGGITSLDSTTLTTLLSNTATALGTSTTAAAPALQNFVNSILTSEIAVANRKPLIQAAAQKAAKNTVAVGAFYGGLVANNPNNEFSTSAGIIGLANTIITDAKIAKAYGEALATTVGSLTTAEKKALASSLVGTKKAAQGLIAQGILRAGTAAQVGDIIDGIIQGAAITDASLAKFAAIAAVGTGDKADEIAAKLAGGKTTLIKTNIAISVIGAAGLASPTAGGAVANAVIATGGFADDTTRLKFGTDVVSKLKTYAAAGSVAAAIVDLNVADSANKPLDAAIAAGVLTAKGSKAGNDIAREVALLSVVGTDGDARAAFANNLADQSKGKYTSNAAVGVSLADPANAGKITVAAITHDTTVDKGSLAKAATIGGAVATAVDEESAADIARAISDKMANTPDSVNKPIKLSLVTALATSLGKAIQAKPGVLLANRMDEFGEVAAALTANVLGKSLTDAAEAKLIAGIGSALIKTLSKTAKLPGNPGGTTPNANSILVASTQTLQADLWEARDIAGSIAQVIENLLADGSARETALLSADGALLKALLLVSGKKGSATYLAVQDAFALVRSKTSGNRFEIGNDPDKITDNRNG